MNINAFTIYLWQLADKLDATLFIFTTLLGVVALFTWVYATTDDESFIPTAKRFTISAIAGAILLTLIPSSKTIAMMVVIPKIADSKAVQQDIPELYNIAIESLKEKINHSKKEEN